MNIWKRNQVISICIIAFCILITCMATIIINKNNEIECLDSYEGKLTAAVTEQDPLRFIHSDFSVGADFTSHMPLVVIDTRGIEPPISTYEDYEQERFIQIEGVEPYVDGTIEIIAGDGYNQLSDKPQVTSQIRIKRRGNSSMLYNKPQYTVKLVTQTGQDRDISILDMGADDEWILNGSMADKSMMRNYLAYDVSSQILPYTPDNQYCEVIIKNGETYTYQGVYLLGESIKQGEDRVAISNYKKNDVFNSYLVRRDRFDENDIMLDTYATRNELSSGYLGLLYPSKYKVTEETISYIENDISSIEQILYSDDFSVFSTYPDYIDVDSFVDYFIINEFFGSYDAGNYSTYMYKDVGGKLCMGPVWDYDGTMDNYRKEPLEVGVTAFQIKPWFDRLMLDESFVKKVENRYADLRRDVLSEKNISDTIDEIAAYIGPAQEREWYRWSEEYTVDNKYSLEPYEDEDGDILYRDAKEYEQEIYRLKTALRKHGNAIAGYLKVLELSTVYETDWSSRMNLALLLIMVVFCISALYANRD